MKLPALLLLSAAAWAQFPASQLAPTPTCSYTDGAGQRWYGPCVQFPGAAILPPATSGPSGVLSSSPAATPKPAGTTPTQTSSVWVGGGVFQGMHHAEPMAIGSVRISKDLWSFNTIEYAGLQRHPFTILTSGEAGLAQRVSTVSGIDVFAILGAGAATTGSSVGGSFAGGFLGMAHFRKWDVGLFARIQHTTGQQAGTTAKLGVVIGVGR